MVRCPRCKCHQQRLNLRLARIAGSLNQMAELHGSMQLVEDPLDPAGKQFRPWGGAFAGLGQGLRPERMSLT